MPQNINEVDISTEIIDDDYCFVSINGSLRRIKKSDFLASENIKATSIDDLIAQINVLGIGKPCNCYLNYKCLSSLADLGMVYSGCGILVRNSATTAQLLVAVDTGVFLYGNLSLTTKKFTYETVVTSSKLESERTHYTTEDGMVKVLDSEYIHGYRTETVTSINVKKLKDTITVSKTLDNGSTVTWVQATESVPDLKKFFRNGTDLSVKELNTDGNSFGMTMYPGLVPGLGTIEDFVESKILDGKEAYGEENGYVIILYSNYVYDGMTFPKPGIYLYKITYADGTYREATEIKNNSGMQIVKLSEDYIPETIARKSEVSSLKSDLDKLNLAPDGVKTAVSALVDKAMSREGNRVLRFLISSDAHQKNDHELITKGTKELAQAHGEVLKLIGVDAVINLGDITWGSSASDSATVLEEAKTFNRFMLDNIRGQKQIWTEGNHETDKLTESQIHALIYSHNKELVQNEEQWVDGYGYMDFTNQKVRVICLNTDQHTGSDSSGVSDVQLKWFSEIALNMEGKGDWSVITMGHHPLSYNNVTLMKNCASVVEAFISGTNFSFTTNSGTNIAIDYSVRSCKYVGHFHGHAHSYSVVKMQKWVATGTYEEINAWEMCIPNACYERNNQYLNNGQYTARYSTETTYSKSDEDGKRTSFNLVTILLDEEVIYLDNYGAGIDRAVSYAKELRTFTITRNLTNCMSTKDSTEIVENEPYYEAMIPHDGYTLTNATATVTMGGEDVTSSVYYDGIINIPRVTGDIVINVVAREISTTTYTNQIPISTDTDGSIYDADGYAENMYLSSGVPSARSGIDCSGFIPIGCGSSNAASGEQIVRMVDIEAKRDNSFRFALYNTDKSFIVQFYGSNLPDSNYGDIQIPYEVDENENVTMFDLTAITANLRDVNEKGTTAFIRICCPNIDGNSILTVNEKITSIGEPNN